MKAADEMQRQNRFHQKARVKQSKMFWPSVEVDPRPWKLTGVVIIAGGSCTPNFTSSIKHLQRREGEKEKKAR